MQSVGFNNKYSKALHKLGYAYAIVIPVGFIFIALFQHSIIGIILKKIPNGPISDKWTNYKNHINLVNPANNKKP
jgi:hypothetical protein